MIADSPAKINLFLHVVGKRQDGFHLLESLFAPLHLSDTIVVSEYDDVSCTVDGADIEDNIVIKAANLLKTDFRIKIGCKIHIAKNIPIGAGLGGGSSNAATVLKMLNELWKLNLTYNQLEKYAIKLGADVPFFIGCKTAFLEGIGEKITPMTLGVELPILLINPNLHVSTKEVFQRGFSEFSISCRGLTTISSLESNLKCLITEGHNDLYDNACEIAPQIKDVIKFLKNQKGVKIARMSGAGSTCFGVFENIKSLHNVQNQVPKNWWSHADLLAL